MSVPFELIELARFMAEPGLDAAILAEGNVSLSGGPDDFWIKGSGRQMGSAEATDFVQVFSAPCLEALDAPPEDENEVRVRLNEARLDPSAASLPSTETFMHAYLLSLPEIRCVAHGHPTPLLSILSLEDAEELAKRRLFPDEIVFCGAASCWVPYVAPGLPLAREIRSASLRFEADFGVLPKSYWLQNHGLIVAGRSAAEVRSGMQMAIKAARVLLGALQTGQEIRFLQPSEVQQIAQWPDEHFRQRLLWGSSVVDSTEEVRK